MKAVYVKIKEDYPEGGLYLPGQVYLVKEFRDFKSYRLLNCSFNKETLEECPNWDFDRYMAFIAGRLGIAFECAEVIDPNDVFLNKDFSHLLIKEE